MTIHKQEVKVATSKIVTLEMECDIIDLIVLLYPNNSPIAVKKIMDQRYPNRILQNTW